MRDGIRESAAKRNMIVTVFVARALIVSVFTIATAVAQSHPATRPESKPARSLSVRAIPFPVKGDASVPSGCNFSPDGRFLVVARGYGGNDLSIYDVSKREIVHTQARQTAPKQDESWANWPPAFNSKSDRLAFTGDHSVSFLEYVSGRWRQGTTVAVSFTPWVWFPNSRQMAWSSDDTVMMFVELGESEETEVHQVVLSSGEDRRLDVGTGRETQNAVFLGKEFGVCLIRDNRYETVLFSNGAIVATLPDIGILVCSADKESWLVARGERAENFGGPQGGLEIWDAKARKPRAHVILDPAKDDSTGLTLAAFSADGAVLVTGDGHKRIAIRDGKTGETLHMIRRYEGDRIVALALSPDGRHLLTMGRPTNREDDGVVLWELTFESGRK